MTYAIVEAGGKQLRVEPGRFYDVDRLSLEVDDEVTLERVLFVNADGESIVGQPVVEGATVVGSVVSHLRGRKIIVYKMQPKKKTRKKRGHRQELTRVMINSIQVGGQSTASETAAEAPAQDTPTAEVAGADAES
ncbi:MAG: 50S ribosomal protein L21 [Nodosilinea sp.]